VTLAQAPSWTLHLLGCERVLINSVRIDNQLDVPNCDGIDPDHCRDVEIKNCNIRCGDDAIVVKTTGNNSIFGPSKHIRVSDCVIETQDSGVKVGTETTQDISDIRFERCSIKTSSRGCTIQLRDQGNVSKILFKDIDFISRYYSAPWWGRGEGISLTAVPRTSDTKLGQLSDVKIVNVTGYAENSVRINGCPASRIRDVQLENVKVVIDRWTKYPGGMWDNRPTSAVPEFEEKGTPGFSVRYADNVSFRKCELKWGTNCPDYFSHALVAESVSKLDHSGLRGNAVRADLLPVVIGDGR
jgi:hypothetical protein